MVRVSVVALRGQGGPRDHALVARRGLKHKGKSPANDFSSMSPYSQKQLLLGSQTSDPRVLGLSRWHAKTWHKNDQELTI